MSKAPRRSRRRPVRDAPELPEAEWIPYLDTWMFVVDYTEGGAPYGVTLEELPEDDRALLLAELEDGNQPPPPVLEEDLQPVPRVRTVVRGVSRRAAPDAGVPALGSCCSQRLRAVQPPSPVPPYRAVHYVDVGSLMLTHVKWKPAVGGLATSIAESGIFDKEQLELLARSFVSAGDAFYWRLPAHWPEAAVTAWDAAGSSLDEPEGPEERPVRTS
jgi:hypothetical protein